MEEVFKWCNDNQGILAAISILIVVVPAMLKIIPKIKEHGRQKKMKNKEEEHDADLVTIKNYLNENIIANTNKLAEVLGKSSDDTIKLLSELLDSGIIDSACDNCQLTDPNSIWELKR